MMTRPRRKLDVAQLLQFTAYGRVIEQNRKFVMKPLHQINQPPAYNTVDRRDWALLDNLGKRLTLRIGKD